MVVELVVVWSEVTCWSIICASCFPGYQLGSI